MSRRLPRILRRRAPPERWPAIGDTHAAWDLRVTRTTAWGDLRATLRSLPPAPRPVVTMAPGEPPRLVGMLPPVRLPRWLDWLLAALLAANVGAVLAMLVRG